MSMWEGSAWQERNEAEKQARAAAPTCRGSIALGSACRRCTKCYEEQKQISKASARPQTAKIERTISVVLDEAAIRIAAGAPADALVDVRAAVDHGPNGITPPTITVTWKERA